MADYKAKMRPHRVVSELESPNTLVTEVYLTDRRVSRHRQEGKGTVHCNPHMQGSLNGPPGHCSEIAPRRRRDQLSGYSQSTV